MRLPQVPLLPRETPTRTMQHEPMEVHPLVDDDDDQATLKGKSEGDRCREGNINAEKEPLEKASKQVSSRKSALHCVFQHESLSSLSSFVHGVQASRQGIWLASSTLPYNPPIMAVSYIQQTSSPGFGLPSIQR